jgi:pSer/pThr/pTyr-binding forkhead associated (FHA) protein
MKAKLIVVAGKASKGSISLTLPTIVGRSQEAGLTVGHPTISRRHAELFEKAGLLMIRDLGSLNGTVIDGQRIKEAPLPPGAEFTIGPLTFRVQYEYKGDRSDDMHPHASAAKAGDDSATTATAETPTELPDFEAVDEEFAKKASAKEPAAQEKKSQGSTGDPFEDLLNELQ